MSTRIGIFTFRAFDLPTVHDFIGIKVPKHTMRFGNKVLSLGESHPFQPPLHAYAPELDKADKARLYKFTSELSPLMAAYWDHVQELSVRREIIRRWYERHRQWELEAERHWVAVDRLHDWMTEVLFQRVYERVGRLQAVYRKIAAQRATATDEFHELHREARLLEAERFPKLLKRALENPFLHEIKEPNQWKALDQARADLAAYRQERQARDATLRAVRRLDALDHLTDLREKQGMDARFRQRSGRFNLRKARFEVADAYEAAWRHTVSHSEAFSELVRAAVVEQANVYPELFKAALIDPWETAIRVPNQDNHFQISREQREAYRAGFKRSVNHERERERLEQDAKKVQLEGQKIERDERFERADGRRIYAHTQATGEALAAGRGQVYLAGRAIPRAPFRIATDVKSTLPLDLGIHGGPSALEQQAAVPPQVDAYFPATAGVRSLEGELFEAAPPARAQEAKRQEVASKMQTMQALNGYGAGKKRVAGGS